MDGFGVVVLAVVTGIGGGTLRDLLLGVRPVFWVDDPTYLVTAAVAAVVTILAERIWARLERGLAVADACGLSLFAVIGAERAMALEAQAVVVVTMGVLTGVGGGLIRDVLARERPYVLCGELYATAALAGATLLLVLERAGLDTPWAMALSAVLCLVVRLAAIRWKIRLPIFRLEPAPTDPAE
jgi:uncharacterized membrane protein YeiH